MKKLMMMIVVAISLFSFKSAEAKLPSEGTVHVTISFDLARPKHNCIPGPWICKFKSTVSASAIGIITKVSSDRIVIEFSRDTRLTEMVGEEGEEVILDKSLANLLGYNSITLLPGTYKIDFSKNSFGTVTINTVTN